MTAIMASVLETPALPLSKQCFDTDLTGWLNILVLDHIFFLPRVHR